MYLLLSPAALAPARERLSPGIFCTMSPCVDETELRRLSWWYGRRLCPWCPHPTASLSGSWASGLDAGPTPHGGRLCPGGSGGPGGGSCPSLEGSQARTWKNLSKPLDQESSWEPLGTWTEASEQVGPLSRQTHCLAMALRRAGPRLHPRPCPHHQGAQAPEEQHL